MVIKLKEDREGVLSKFRITEPSSKPTFNKYL